jgi:DNA-3-methyladenine glycosylase
VVARDCLGKLLVLQSDQGKLCGRIVETEAYVGPRDRACHAYGGRRTARTEVMYGEPGHAYVYFVYGLHHHLNLVTDPEGFPSAVLLRAVEPLIGIDLMRARRGTTNIVQLANGPGKLCQAYAIDRRYNGVDLCRPPLYLVDGPPPARIMATARVGVDYAGTWARRRLRFIDQDSPFAAKPTRPRR